MKKILLFFFFVCTTSCYRDLGNYSYTFDEQNYIEDLNFRPASFFGSAGETIEVPEAIAENEHARIDVSLKQTLYKGFDDLDFFWRVTHINGADTIRDTLRTVGFLDLPLPMGKPIRYTISLEIKDRKTPLAHYRNFAVETRPIYKNSLFVLHGANATDTKLGNIDSLGVGYKVVTDAYKNRYPSETSNPFATAIGLSYSAYLIHSKQTGENLTVYRSDGTATVYNPFGLQAKFTPIYALPIDTEKLFLFKRFVSTGTATSSTDYKCVLSSNGQFYTARTFACFHKPANVVSQIATDYKATAATITDTHFILWDATHNRFMTMRKEDNYGYSEVHARQAQLSNALTDVSVDCSQLGDLSPIGKEAVYAYINDREKYSSAHPFFIFKNQEGKYFLYELTSSGIGKEDKDSDKEKDDKDKDKEGKDKDKEGGNSGNPEFFITASELKNIPKNVVPTTIVYNNYFATNYLFFGAGSVVYRYNTSSGDLQEIYTAPEGYQVSVLKFRNQDTGLFFGDLGLYLSIGLNKGRQGAVTEVKLTHSSDVDASFVSKLFEKDDDGNVFGNIKDLQFANVYLYKLRRQ